MNKSAAILMPTFSNRTRANGLKAVLISLLHVLMLITYLLPWVTNPGAGLTLNAYDLAEWSSLAPGARSDSPILLTTLLLRLPAVCIALFIIMQVAKRMWLKAVLVIVFAVALLPPIEFFRQATDDPNYRQQFVLALLILIGGVVMTFRRRIPVRVAEVLEVSLVLVGIVSGIWGLARAYQAMQQFSLPVQIGWGAILMPAAALLWLILNVIPIEKARSSDSNG